MRIDDVIHGSAEIEHPLLIDLIESAAFQRLRGVLQAGITGLLDITHPHTRYDHSLGAMLVVRRLGGGIEEQAAALLHDISHTAMSHVMDHVFDSPLSQSYHDHEQANYVGNSDIPAICRRHAVDWQQLLDESAWPLLEQPSPALCADRIDYFLRDAFYLHILTLADIGRIWAHLAVHDGRIVFNELATARLFAERFMQTDDDCWANFWEVGLYEVTGRAIRRGLEVGAIDQRDVWGTDRPLWHKLRAFDDAELQARLALVSAETEFVHDPAQPDFTVTTKIRTIDPHVLHENELKSLSAWDAEYAKLRQTYLARKAGAWPMRVVKQGRPPHSWRDHAPTS